MNALSVLIAGVNREEYRILFENLNQYNSELLLCFATSQKEIKASITETAIDCIFFDTDHEENLFPNLLSYLKSIKFQGQIIAISSNDEVSKAVNCMKRGVTDYLLKRNISEETIKLCLQQAKENKQQHINQAESEAEQLARDLKLKNIIAKSPIAIFNIQLDGTISLFKGNAGAPISIRQESVVGRNIRNFENNLPIRQIDFEKAINGDDFEFFTTVGNRHFEVQYIPILDTDKRVKEMMGIAIDITSFKENEIELMNTIETKESSRRIKEQFIANMSHEIRTPIHGIISLTEFLLMTQPSVEQNNYLQLIKKSADTLLVIINDILDLSKLEAGKMNFEKIPFNITDTLQTAVAAFIPKATDKNLQIKTNLHGITNKNILGDPVRLIQIINNLISNAVKFTLDGYVSLTVKEISDNKRISRFEFTVEDTGIGIPAERIERIFDDFIQGGDEISRKYGGTGLGLGIAKALIENQQGTISVTSTPGIGTKFVFTIEYEQTSSSIDDCQSIEDDPHFPGKEIRILIAEDHDINRFIIKKMLTEWTIDVHCVESGTEAIEAVRTGRYDMVLMDIEMPEMNGYEATRQIRSECQDGISGIPIIAMTGHAMVGEREKCLEAGMNDYISKPFKAEKLKKVIKRWFNPANKNVSTLTEMKGSERKINTETNQIQDSGSRKPENQWGRQISSAVQHINLDFLREISDNNEEFYKQFILLFLTNTPLSLESIYEGIRESNWEKIRQSAHKIKPSFSYIGLKELSTCAAEIEACAKNKENLSKISELYKHLNSACLEAFSELEQEIKTSTN